jgi:hypothetical protein
LSPAGTTLVYSTYLGGSGEEKPLGIAVDAGAAAFVTGYTHSTDFPTRNPVQSTNNNPAAGTCFVTKLGAAGNVVIWSTYLGGAAGDVCYGIAADNADEAYVTGTTYSPDFPVLLPYQANMPGSVLAFATKFSATGRLVYSTFLGGNGDALANAIAVDSAGAAYLTGGADSENFPVPNGFQRTSGTSGGPFVAKLQLTGVATIVVNTTPTGLDFTVDGTDYTTGQSFTWATGSSHTIGVNSPQTGTGVAGTRYVFANWSDSGLQTHSITVSSSGGTYTASFTTQYLLSVSASPAAGGIVIETPASSDGSGYYSTGTSVSLAGSPNTGYAFSSWSGDLSGSASPQSVNMTAPRTVTANFAAGIAFFAGSVNGGSGTQYLQFPNGKIFGYYAFLSSIWMYHVDLGYEVVVPGNGPEVYLWDLSSGEWWYTNTSSFPYLYDFTRKSWIYYFPDTTKAGHYTTNPRYFVNMTTGVIFTM